MLCGLVLAAGGMNGVSAQPPDSYFPDQVGNVWQYRSVFMGHITQTIRFLKDSLAAAGSRFVWYSSQGFELVYEIDTLHNVWDSSPYDFARLSLRYSLAAGVGDAWAVNLSPPPFDSAKVMDISPGSVFGRAATIKAIDYWRRYELGDSLWFGTRYLASGFGMVQYDIEPSDVWYLAGAIIDSVQWGTIVDVDEPETTPKNHALLQNYPNPFNPSTTIRYGLPSRSHVTLTVFNTLGQQVATLVQGEQEAGFHEAVFDASVLASGVYVYRLQSGETILSRKMVLVH